MKKFAFVLVLVTSLTMLMGAAVAAAQPGSNGATTINVDTCVPLIGGGTVCITARGVIKETSTPTARTSFVTNYREEINVLNDDGEIVTTYTSKEHFPALTMDAMLHQISERSRFTVTNFGQTFCVQYHLQYANGQDQFFRIDYC